MPGNYDQALGFLKLKQHQEQGKQQEKGTGFSIRNRRKDSPCFRKDAFPPFQAFQVRKDGVPRGKMFQPSKKTLEIERHLGEKRMGGSGIYGTLMRIMVFAAF